MFSSQIVIQVKLVIHITKHIHIHWSPNAIIMLETYFLRHQNYISKINTIVWVFFVFFYIIASFFKLIDLLFHNIYFLKSLNVSYFLLNLHRLIFNIKDNFINIRETFKAYSGITFTV